MNRAIEILEDMIADNEAEVVELRQAVAVLKKAEGQPAMFADAIGAVVLSSRASSEATRRAKIAAAAKKRSGNAKAKPSAKKNGKGSRRLWTDDDKLRVLADVDKAREAGTPIKRIQDREKISNSMLHNWIKARAEGRLVPLDGK